MKILLPLHLLFAGVWLGCVLTEALFERALLGKGRQQELILVELHKRVDLIIETPAFVAVLVSGILLYFQAEADWLLHTKIGIGLLAVATNVYCVRLVFLRATAAKLGVWKRFSHLDKQQHLYGALVLVALLVTAGIGLTMVGRA
jgi:uncharacterized membrane protein